MPRPNKTQTTTAQPTAPRPARRPAHQGKDDLFPPLHSRLSESCTEKTAARELPEVDGEAVTTLHSALGALIEKVTSSPPVRLYDMKSTTDEPSVGSSVSESVIVEPAENTTTPSTVTVGRVEPPGPMLNVTVEGTRREPVTMTGTWITGDGADGAEVLRLLQFTIHLLLVQLAWRVVGQRGGGPTHFGAKEDVAEELAIDGREDGERDGDRDIGDKAVLDVLGESGNGEVEGTFDVEVEKGASDEVGERELEAEETRVLFHCPWQTVPSEHAVEKVAQGLRSVIVRCPVALEANKLGRTTAR